MEELPVLYLQRNQVGIMLSDEGFSEELQDSDHDSTKDTSNSSNASLLFPPLQGARVLHFPTLHNNAARLGSFRKDQYFRRCVHFCILCLHLAFSVILPKKMQSNR